MRRRSALLASLIVAVLLWASPALAAITFLEAGTNATYGTQFWDAKTGTVTSDSGTVHTGPRSMKMVNYGSVTKNSVTNTTNRISFYVRFSALPAATTSFWEIGSTGNGNHRFDLLSTGILRFRDVNGANHDGTTVLTGGTWYRLSLAYTITSAAVNEWRVFLNGVLEITISNIANSSVIGTPQVALENFDGGSGTSVFFSDFYVDDSSALTDPGDIRVTAKLPASVNTGNFNVTVGTGAVDERPLSETNGMEDTTVNGDQQNYTLQTAAVGDVDLTGATLIGRSAWIWAKITVASVLAKIMDNGSESAVTLTASSALYTLLTSSASYPSNAAGIGARSSTTADTFLYECGTLIAYLPAVAVGPKHRAIISRRFTEWAL